MNTILESIGAVEDAVYADDTKQVSRDRVTVLFGGKMDRIIRCAECDEESRRSESFTDLCE